MAELSQTQKTLLDIIAEQAKLKFEKANGNHFHYFVHEMDMFPDKIIEYGEFQFLRDKLFDYFKLILDFRSTFDIQKEGTENFKNGLGKIGFDFYTTEISTKMLSNSLCCLQQQGQLLWVHLCWLLQEFLTQIYAGGIEDILETVYWSADALNGRLSKGKAIQIDDILRNRK